MPRRQLSREEEEARFWSKVKKTDKCWEWIGRIDKNGYGQFYLNGGLVKITTHRYAYISTYGMPPAEKPHVCHTCDNRKCTRPDHLFAGTRADNMRDMVNKGRHALQVNPELVPRGSKNGFASLTEAQAEEILKLRFTYNVGPTELAKRFGVGLTTIKRVIRGICWAHVSIDNSTEKA